MEGLKPGRIVYFVFDKKAVDEVNRRRTTEESVKDRMRANSREQWPRGAQAHIGNTTTVLEIAPAIVTRVVDEPDGRGPERVNLKVMLDGSDNYWVTNVSFDSNKQPGTWHWMFEGQATRYDASKRQ
jgi:hypothetical protein